MSKNDKPNPAALLIPIFGLVVCAVMIAKYSGTPAPPPPPIVVPDFVPTPPVLPTPEPEPPQPQPRDITTEPTATLLAEWNAWRHGPAPRTDEVQAIYEQLVSRGVIRRDGEPVSESGGGRRKIGRRR